MNDIEPILIIGGLLLAGFTLVYKWAEREEKRLNRQRSLDFQGKTITVNQESDRYVPAMK